MKDLTRQTLTRVMPNEEVAPQRNACDGPGCGPWMSCKMTFNHKGRAISSILATVLVVAVTLAASLAVSGFVFGAMGHAQNPTQVAVTEATLLASNFKTTGSTQTFTCASTSSAAFLALTNSGSGAADVVGVSITWAAGNTAYTPPGACSIGASGSATATQYIIFPATTQINPDAISRQPYTGTVTLSNGAQLLFTGTWQ